MYKNEAFVLRSIYGKHILMPVKANKASEDPILFNDVAKDIWENADNDLGVESFTEKICTIYCLQTGSPEAIAVASFVAQLVDMGLIMEDREA